MFIFSYSTHTITTRGDA